MPLIHFLVSFSLLISVISVNFARPHLTSCRMTLIRRLKETKKCIRDMPAPVSGAYVSRCLLAVTQHFPLFSHLTVTTEFLFAQVEINLNSLHEIPNQRMQTSTSCVDMIKAVDQTLLTQFELKTEFKKTKNSVCRLL